MNELYELYCKACGGVSQKYNKPFLTNEEYQKEIGKYSEISGNYYHVVRILNKALK